MSPFPRDRYDVSEFLRGFDVAEVGRDGNEVCISFPIQTFENDEMTIYFPGCTDDPPSELLRLARQTCMRVAQLDNLVQDSCENEWRRSGRRIDDYELYLAHIKVEANVVRLEYYGSKVNTQWTAEFTPSTGESWTKVNF